MNRLAQLRAAMDTDLVVVGATRSLRHLAGHQPLAMERMTALLVTQTDAVMILPAFDAEEFAEASGIGSVLGWTDHEGPAGAVERAFAQLGLPPDATAQIDPELPFAFYARLRDHLPTAPTPATGLLGRLRQVKDADEIALMTRAAEVVSDAMDFALAHARVGMAERELAAAIEERLRAGGAGQLAFALVQTGPASAIGHHEPGSDPLLADAPVLIDIATSVDEYWSDMTQNVFLGEPPQDYLDAYEVVVRAEEAGVQALRPGNTTAQAARAAQAIVADAGFGEYAGGRIGHGIGLDVHEPPNVIEWDETELVPGMVLTMEPGIYIPGRYGIRIEDTVLVTDGDPVRLTRAPRPALARAVGC